MKQNHFEITIFSASGRTERNIIARSTTAALRAALNTFPEDHAPTCLICKPGKIAVRPIEKQAA